MGLKRARVALRDEQGLTTVSMAVCIFLALALIFSAGQLYRVSSSSADVQEVADVSAMAAQQEVSKYMSTANGCDAVLFTMTLTCTIVMGIGVVAACIPQAAPLSERLISCGRKIADARDRAASSMADALNALQRALPFVAAARAADLAARNDLGDGGSEYRAVALLIPVTGTPISVEPDDLGALVVKTEDEAPEIREKAAEAEELARDADESKLAAYKADCGDAPGYCMYQRAQDLAHLSGASNPHYSSVDAWSFKVALERCRAYYRARYERESAYADAGLSVEDRADSMLRKHFYEHVWDELEDAVSSSGDRCSFPPIFKNLEEMKGTDLYTAPLFPMTVSGGRKVMHAWDGCPAASGWSQKGSISQIDGAFITCDQCELTPSTFGNVASASTATASGYEHYYRIVREECERYNEVMDRLEPLKEQVEGTVGSIFQTMGNLLSGGAGSKRIHAEPPGSAGAIALVVNAAQVSASAGFESSFVSSGATLGVRAAVAGASLQEDEEMPDTTVMDAVLDGIAAVVPGSDAATRTVSGLWSDLVRAWGSGQRSISDALDDGLDGLHTATASGLASWAEGALTGLIEGLGLEPPSLFKLRPVLVNTAHVAGADSGSLAVRYLQVKQQALVASTGSTDAFSSLAAAARSGVEAELSSLAVEVALPIGDVEVPITLALPASVQEGAADAVGSAFDALAGFAATATGQRSWQ